MEEQLVNAIRVMLHDEMSSVNERLTSLEAVTKARHELSQEHNIIARLRKLEETLAHLTGKVVVFSAAFSILVGVIIKLLSHQ